MEEYMKPINKDGDTVLEVECGKNKAMMYVSKLCQGSKGPCILFQEEWLTPNEFQFVSGRQTAKDWKRSIRHHGKSLKLLLNKGLVSVHPPICDCTGCRQASPKVRFLLYLYTYTHTYTIHTCTYRTFHYNIRDKCNPVHVNRHTYYGIHSRTQWSR